MLSKKVLVIITHYLVLAVILKILGFILPGTIVAYYEYAAKLLLFFMLAAFTFEFAKRRYLQDKVEPINKAVLITDFWAIVNNAGVYRGNNVELSSMEDYKYTMEVNAFGLARVTKAFLPLLRQFKGRVVNLTSLAGKLAGPHIAPYTMSKHAAKAFSECLALEMGTWGIKVISVEPEFFRTAMTNSKAIRAHLKRTFQDLNPHLKKEYGDDYLDTVRKRVESVFENSSPKMDIVLDDLESAVSLKNPYSAYICYGNIIHAISLYAAERLPKSITDFLVEMYLTIAHGSLRRPHSLKKFL
ncbi:D-beta-hydroxybutyrate dehydrogenase, mitochondrial-like isoform X3 [Stegodyphus dumicola]|uniref:D-beta-hydroxybutyrate dehydrogenase, mitochondrial-like isoform X3 n=1 Tax=Stegodyphus dumicola TaxID=202533 RepID=UPI0015B2A8D4|nr:D-beta-hydroxybutyrate dehydrogenase, mitochondrial-like isoform X3 [Stegodyphus dumicola]